MRRRLTWRLVLAALAAASMTTASTVSAASVAKPASLAKQRVMVEQKHMFGAPTGTFVLHALTRGHLQLDAGRYTYEAAEMPFLARNGQRSAVYVAVETLTGRRGTLVVRWRVELVGAGDGNTVGTGTWSLVRGTAAYAGMTGGGRLAVLMVTPGGYTSLQFEGLVTGPDNRRSPPPSRV